MDFTEYGIDTPARQSLMIIVTLMVNQYLVLL